MILICHSCSTRLSIDDAKVPAQPFTVRCSKCGSAINAQPHEVDAGTDLLPIAAAPVPHAGGGQDEVMKMLTQVLREVTSGKQERDAGGRRWETKRVLVCVQPEHCEQVTAFFDEQGYEVFAPTDAMNAIKQMREEHVDVLVLAPEFDAVEQGALFIMREISALRMPERRRIFIIQASATARTADAHAAFVNSVNLVVNTAELDRLPAAFNRAEREFKELYYDFNKAFAAAVR